MKTLDGLVKALRAGYGSPYNKLIISCDKSDPCMAQQMVEAIECTDIANTSMDVELIFHDDHLGCTGNTRYCLERSFEDGQEYTVHLEDDTYPGLDLLGYFNAVAPILDNYFAACTFHRPIHELVAPSPSMTNRLVAKNVFEGAGGFAITRKRWERILEMGGMFGVDYLSPKAKHVDCRGEEWLREVNGYRSDRLGFDWPFDRYFSEGLPSLYPVVSRVINIGKAGLHLSPNQWEKLQYNPNWINSASYNFALRDRRNWNTVDILVDDKKYTEDGYE